MEKPVEPVVSVKPSNAATAVEAATAHTNSRNFTRVNNIRMRQKIGIELSPANQNFINGYNRLISTLPLKPTPTFNRSNPPQKPKISSSTPVIMAPNTKRSTVFKVSNLFTPNQLSKLASQESQSRPHPKLGGKRTKKRSKKAKKTRKH